MKGNSFLCLGEGLYQKDGHFYHRPKLPSGARTWRSLRAPTRKAARIAIARLNGHGLTTQSELTVKDALAEYVRAGYPDRRRQKRTPGKSLTQEVSSCQTLARFFASFQCAKLNSAVIDDYADWRMKTAKRGHGGRAAELDLNTLKNALRWSTRKGLLDVDPFRHLPIPRYRKEKIRHCREVAPRSGDELHAMARHLLEGDKHSQVLGWLTLIVAFTGCRISEVTALRLDAPEGLPGHYSKGVLWLRRVKGGCNNFIKTSGDAPNPHLKPLLEEFFAWRSRLKPAYQKSKWWFPGVDPRLPVGKDSLTQALRRVGRLLFGEIRTAHSLRSMYVTCRRSVGVSDAQIALELGQTSGGREIRETYGEATPLKMSWMPKKGPPAWEVIPQNQNVPRGTIVKP